MELMAQGMSGIGRCRLIRLIRCRLIRLIRLIRCRFIRGRCRLGRCRLIRLIRCRLIRPSQGQRAPTRDRGAGRETSTI